MKNLIIVLVALFTTAISLAQGVNNYEIGDVVDDFSVLDTEGNELNLYEITAQGKYVYLDFFFVDCVPCQETASVFNEFYDSYGCNEGGLFMISMNAGVDSDLEVEAFKDEFGGSFHHAPAVSADGGSASVVIGLGVNWYPTFVLIGADNTLLKGDVWASNLEASIPASANAQQMACTLGVNDADIFNFSLYPNPTSVNDITIALGYNVNQASVIIYNILGAVIYSQEHKTNQIAIATVMARGRYIVSVKTAQGTLNKILIVK